MKIASIIDAAEVRLYLERQARDAAFTPTADTLELRVHRIAKRDGYTIGRLYVGDRKFCDTLEPTWRDVGWGRPGRKVPGKTAIPEFQRWLEKMGFVENGKLTKKAGDGSSLLF